MVSCLIDAQELAATVDKSELTKEVSKVLSERYHALNEEEKAEVEKMAKDDKERYAREVSAWEKAHPGISC